MFDKYPALVLNADYRPLSTFPLEVWTWKDTVKKVYEGVVTVVAEHQVPVRSPSTQFLLPSVVALKKYQPQPHRIAFTRYNVFLRDHFTCQYCDTSHKPNHLTFDHVIPRSKGGPTTWDNIATACESCNTMKDNGEHMRPLRWPQEPTMKQLLKAQMKFPPNFLHESWLDFLYWDTEIEN